MKELSKVSAKIKSRDEALKVIREWEVNNEKLVFTNGCFDIVHRGHVDYLSRAKDLGTKLILGLNTDASVQLQSMMLPLLVVDQEVSFK